MSKHIDIISIGDELLIGQVINSNATWMGQKLSSLGMKINRMEAVADTRDAITNALENAARNARVVLVTGGLGPTKDDLTKEVVCDFFDSNLVLDENVRRHVEIFFEKRGFDLTKLNFWQAMVPDNCQVIPNAVGTAPGMHFEKDNVHYLFMPGVPMEMKHIMESWALPFFKELCQPEAFVQKTVLTHGMGESFLADKIEGWESELPEKFSLAYLPSPGRVRLRISARGDDEQDLQRELDNQIEKLHAEIGLLIYGYDDDTLEELVGKLLLKNNLSLSTAESCTGGMIAQKITSIAGSSQYFKGSVVAYSNEIKEQILSVRFEDLEKYGAVSEVVVLQMAENMRNMYSTDYALAVSGIAGPGGGTPEKPVGTVWISIAGPQGSKAQKFLFGGERVRNIDWAYQTALNMLRLELL
ncbi:MAG: competence/damage-inducible protein A [Bacteroidales bacterium]|nr:competence/damage-inducible protein A [Bacteroidales bacterium]